MNERDRARQREREKRRVRNAVVCEILCVCVCMCVWWGPFPPTRARAGGWSYRPRVLKVKDSDKLVLGREVGDQVTPVGQPPRHTCAVRVKLCKVLVANAGLAVGVDPLDRDPVAVGVGTEVGSAWDKDKIPIIITIITPKRTKSTRA